MSKVTRHGIRKLTQPSDAELLTQIKQAQHSGAQDLLGAEYSAREPVTDTRIDKQEFYGAFYDDLQPEIKKLANNLSRSLLFNGQSFDRQRSNQDFVLFKKQFYANPGSQYESRTITNYNARGGIIIVNALDINIVSDSFYITIEGLEPAGGNWYNILVSDDITTGKLYLFKIYPGLNPQLGQTSNDILPRNWRVVVRYNSGQPIDFGISGSMIL